MAHGVIRTDLMSGTDVGADLVSVKYMGSGTTATAIDNGNIVKLSGLMSGEREIWKGVTPAANSDLGDIVVIASEEVNYDERKRNLSDYTNDAGKICRGYRVHKGNVFSVTADALTNNKEASAAIVVGDLVECAAGTKMSVVASATNSTTKVGTIVAIDTTTRYTYYVICVG